jgi:cell division protein FtsN
VKEKPGTFTIQVSAFKTAPEAQSYVKLLSAKGFTAHIKPASVEGKGTWYRVRVGSFTSSAAAETYKDKLARENLPAWIVKAD